VRDIQCLDLVCNRNWKIAQLLSQSTHFSGIFPEYKKFAKNAVRILFRKNQEGCTAYAVYDNQGYIVKRVDLLQSSAPHFNKDTQTYINPPHVENYERIQRKGEFKLNHAGTRPARPEEIPKYFG